MAKNLYIHKIYKDCNYTKEIWEDVKITRDEGRIVKKRGADYNLKMGVYKNKEMLDVIRPIKTGYPKSELSYVEFITFDKDILSQDDISEMCMFFIDELNINKIELENEIMKLDDKIDLFENLKVEEE